MLRVPITDPIEYLVGQKYPTFPNGKLLEAIISPEKLAETEKQQAIYRERLKQKTSEEIAVLVAEAIKASDAKIYEFRQKQRVFYERDTANADFDFWSRATSWTLEEAVALSFGKEPKVVNSSSLKYETSNFAREYEKLRDLTRRAVPFQKLYDPVLPSIYIAWVKQNEISFPQELEDLIIKRGNHIVNWYEYYKKLEESYNALGELNTKNVNVAHERFAGYEARITELGTQLQVQQQQNTNTPKPDYTSPYIQLMEAGIIANSITAGNQGKAESLKQWFMDNAPPELEMTDKKASAMATLIRLPESGKGGNRKAS